MLTLLDDLRFTVRQLRRAPGFTMNVIATLTLAVTANVMVYGIANGLVFVVSLCRRRSKLCRCRIQASPGIRSPTLITSRWLPTAGINRFR